MKKLMNPLDFTSIKSTHDFPRAAKFFHIAAIIAFIFLFAACQSNQVESPVSEDGQQPDLAVSDNSNDTPNGSETAEEGWQEQPLDLSMDPAEIQKYWEGSPHAATFVEGIEGNNNTCARCHAPANWFPSIDDMPESCFACKFEVSDPPPYIAENEWEDISCNICHKIDKKDNVQPEYTYLEVAAIEEYSTVATTTELCRKCHTPVDLPGHDVPELGGAHGDYDCTECHDAHGGIAVSCGSADCHADVIGPEVIIAGHDQDHQRVLCVACHDGGGMDVGLIEDRDVWTTIVTGTMENDQGVMSLTSHNLVKEASCDRCHFENNPWDLSDSVSTP